MCNRSQNSRTANIMHRHERLRQLKTINDAHLRDCPERRRTSTTHIRSHACPERSYSLNEDYMQPVLWHSCSYDTRQPCALGRCLWLTDICNDVLTTNPRINMWSAVSTSALPVFRLHFVHWRNNVWGHCLFTGRGAQVLPKTSDITIIYCIECSRACVWKDL